MENLFGSCPEEQTHQRQETFCRTLDYYPDALMVIRCRQILYANEACLRLLGAVRSEQVVGRSPLDFVPPDHHLSFLKRMQELRATSRPSPFMEVQVISLSQKTLDVEAAMLPFKDQDQKTIHVILRDTAARKQATKALRESEALFQKVFEEGPLGMMVIGVDFRLQGVNTQLCRMLGYTQAELLGRTIADITYPEDVEVCLEQARRLMYGEIPRYTLEKRYLTKCGQTVWGALHVSMIGGTDEIPGFALGMVEDITERKRAEAVLYEEKQRFDQLVAMSPGVICTFRLRPDGTSCLPYAGPSIQQIFSVTPEQVAEDASAVFAVIHPDDVERVRKSISDSAQSMQTWHEEFRVRNQVRGEIWIEGRSTPQREPEGSVLWYGFLTDTTAAKEAEQKMRNLREIAERQAQMLAMANRNALDILASQTGIEAIQHIAETACELVQARYAAIGVVGSDGNTLEEFITVGVTPEQERAIGQFPCGNGLVRQLLLRTEPLILDRIREHPASSGFPAGHPEMNTLLGVPIRLGDKVMGSLFLTEKADGKSFTESDAVTVEALSAHVAVAIRNLHLLRQQRALVSGLISAEEEERRTIAYDLHDGLTQYVMGAHAFLQSSQAALESGQMAEADENMRQGLQYLEEAVIESRRLVNGLRALALDDLGLADALKLMLNEEKAHAGWTEANLIHNLNDLRLNSALETTVFRVAQEALTNARKHAETQVVQVTLLCHKGIRAHSTILTLQVRDWGKGFAPSERHANYAHIGLQGLAERVHLFGGKLDIQSAPDCGTIIRATFPIPDTLDDMAGKSTSVAR